MKRIVEKVRSILGLVDGEVAIDPPDVITILRDGRVAASRVLVCRSVDYAVRDFSEASARRYMEAFATIISKLPVNAEVRVVKDEVDVKWFTRRLVNEILNTRVRLESSMDEHSRVKHRVRLDTLSKLYEAVLKGEALSKTVIVVKIRARARRLEEARSILDYHESAVSSVFKSYYGLVLERASKKELARLLALDLNLDEPSRMPSVVAESLRLGFLHPFPLEKKYAGLEGVFIGVDLRDGGAVLIPVEQLFKHMVVIGPTGRGKTTLLAAVIESATIAEELRITSLDFKGDLVKYLPPKLLRVYTPDDIVVNLAQRPPYTTEPDWRMIVTDALSNALNADPGKIVEALEPVEKAGVSALLHRGESSILLPLFELFNRPGRYEALEGLHGENSLIDLSSKSLLYQNVYAGVIIGVLRHALLKRGGLGNLIVVDEAWRVGRLRSLAELVKEGRSRRVGVVLATQNPGDLPREILENASNIVFFGSLDEEYVARALKTTGLSEDYAQHVRRLGVGEALYVNADSAAPVFLRVKTPLSLNPS